MLQLSYDTGNDGQSIKFGLSPWGKLCQRNKCANLKILIAYHVYIMISMIGECYLITY